MSNTSNKARPTFKCCACNETFSVTIDTSEAKQIIITCPYCETESKVNLNDYKKGATEILRDGNTVTIPQYAFPTVIPTVIPTEK